MSVARATHAESNLPLSLQAAALAREATLHSAGWGARTALRASRGAARAGFRTARALTPRLLRDQVERFRDEGYSIWSTDSKASIGSIRSHQSFVSIWSLWSMGSVCSLFSAGSVLSIGSAGSMLSVGSAGSVLSIGSSSSIMALGGRNKRPAFLSRAGSVDDARAQLVTKGATMLAVAALARAVASA